MFNDVLLQNRTCANRKSQWNPIVAQLPQLIEAVV